MADKMSPLAKLLRTTWFHSPFGTSDENLWSALATAAREHLSPAPPAAPTERPTCATCPYWNSPQGADGRWPCRRHAPRHIGSQCDDFAITAAEEWCGDHPAFPAYIASRRAPT